MLAAILVVAAELLDVDPGLTASKFVKTLPFEEPEQKEGVRDLLL